jgi:hypothetical protein
MKAIHGSQKFVPNLSEHVFTESEESVLMRGLNFAVTKRMSNLGMVQYVWLNLQYPNFPPPWVLSSVGGFDVCWKNQTVCRLK